MSENEQNDQVDQNEQEEEVEKKDDEEKKDGTSKGPEPRVWVGNLSFDTTDESLTKAFESIGKVVSVKIPRRNDGRSKGFGFVEFETLEDANKAVEEWKGQRELDGRPVEVNIAKPRDEHPHDRRGGYRDRRDKDRDYDRRDRRDRGYDRGDRGYGDYDRRGRGRDRDYDRGDRGRDYDLSSPE